MADNAGIQLIDAVASKLNETTIGDLTAEATVIPDIDKKGLGNKMIVGLQGIESHEIDRTREALTYTVGIGYHAAARTETDYRLHLSQIEEMHDWLTDRDNRKLVVTAGTFEYQPPFTLESVFDASLIKEAGIMFSISFFNYRLTKNRK